MDDIQPDYQLDWDSLVDYDDAIYVYGTDNQIVNILDELEEEDE